MFDHPAPAHLFSPTGKVAFGAGAVSGTSARSSRTSPTLMTDASQGFGRPDVAAVSRVAVLTWSNAPRPGRASAP